MPFMDLDYEWSRKILASINIITAELEKTRVSGWQESQYSGKIHAENGNWTSFYFYQVGDRITENHLLCPETSKLIDLIPNRNPLGT